MTGVSVTRQLGIFCLLAMVPASVLASGEGMPSLVRDIGICIVLAGLLAIVFVRIRIPEIAAFLLAGVVVGPVGAELVTDPANIETISELGLILLLYLIGLEIDIRKLLDSGRILAVSGLLQYPLCVLFGVLVTKLLVSLGIGGALLSDGYAPLYIGFVVAASSTLLVVKLFQETFQLDTEVGRIALGLLIFQDIWAIGVIAVQPNLAAPAASPILLSFLGIVVLAILAAFIARFIIPIGFKWVAKKPEVVFATSISWCFLIVLLGVNLDVLTNWLFNIDLHMRVGAEMGALIAGATIANLPYSTEIVSKVSVVKDFFITLFFVGLGMSIPMPEGMDVLLLAGLFAVIALLARFVIFFPLLYAAGLDRRNAMVTSVRLAQISEFSLVIGFIGVQLGQISANLNSAIIFAFVITALLTPLLFQQADAIHDRLSAVLARLGFREPSSSKAGEDDSYSLALLGFHRVASSLLYELGKNHPELLKSTLVVDFNVNLHPKIAALGPTVKYGDLGNAETLHHTGVDKARVIVCTIPDDVLKGTTNLKLVEAARHINPNAVIIANATELSDSHALYEAGADYVFLQRIETARAVEQAIEVALSGDIDNHRSAVEALHGAWHAREEVM
ncbi:MAG: cation:proton antiporter [Gammaproteobacteria bacterium]|nr:cation:proton antiporter [Gammaproteobacteria bacterium]